MSVLAIRSLSKTFGGVRAVNDVSFEIGQGEFLAMIGPNGAGKSTCFNMINGQLTPDSGRFCSLAATSPDLRRGRCGDSASAGPFRSPQHSAR